MAWFLTYPGREGSSQALGIPQRQRVGREEGDTVQIQLTGELSVTQGSAIHTSFHFHFSGKRSMKHKEAPGYQALSLKAD